MPVYGFSQGDAARIGAAVGHFEKYPKFYPPRKGRRPSVSEQSVIPCTIGGSAIGSGTDASPTGGSVTLMVPNGSGGPGLVAGDVVTAYNRYGTSAPAGKRGYVTWAYGFWYLTGWDC
jgi:hypothetical protein